MTHYGKMAAILTAVGIAGCMVSYAAAAYNDYSAETNYAAADEECFVVKEYNGVVALFSEGKEAPIAVYNTPIDYINPADAEMLKDGIRLKSMDEVARLLEDLDVE